MLMRMHAPRRGLCRDAIFPFPLNDSKHLEPTYCCCTQTYARDNPPVGLLLVTRLKLHGVKRFASEALIHWMRPITPLLTHKRGRNVAEGKVVQASFHLVAVAFGPSSNMILFAATCPFTAWP